MKEYVWFYEETDANEFFLDCLERGIYAKKTYGSGMYGIEIDVERTCKEKNTVLIELEVTCRNRKQNKRKYKNKTLFN